MPLPPQRRRPIIPAGNHTLANGDQNLTEVDARLPKVDTANPRANPKPQQNTAQDRKPNHPDTSIVNPRCQPLRRIPNKPEQP